jgi:ubiquitin carboxyl-terminal hydrolase 9/24
MTQNHESRSNVFYEVLQELIFTMPVEVLSPLKSQVEVLIG